MVIVLLAVYFFIILRFVVTLFNFLSDPKLRRVNKQYHTFLSILIPVRNEAKNIMPLLHSIAEQDYQDYEVIILDDGSTDDTVEICRGFATANSRFRVIKGEELAPDWQGKNYACHQLAKVARGQYMLFLDARLRIKRGLLNSAIHRMVLKRLSLLSLAADEDPKDFNALLVRPLKHYLLLNLLPLQLVYLFKTPLIAAASGEFMLFNADSYHHHQWHREVKNNLVEDTAVMRLVKSAGLNGELLLANNMAYCQPEGSYGSLVSGFGRHLLAVFNYNVLALLLYITVLLSGPLLIITTLSLNLIVLMFGLITLGRIMIALLAGQSAWKNVLLHPVQLVMLMFTAFLAVQRHLTRTTIWKGRRV